MDKPKRLTGYKICEDGTHGPMHVGDTLDAMQEAIGGYFDVSIRYVGQEKREYAIIFDDEGILRGRDVTAICLRYPALVGDLLILGIDNDVGDFKSLPNNDLDYISKSLKMIQITNGSVIVRPVLEVL